MARRVEGGKGPLQGADWRGVIERVAENLMGMGGGRRCQIAMKNEGLVLSDMEKH